VNFASENLQVERSRLVGLLLVLVTLLAYAPVCFHDYIFFDDPAYVADNPMVQAGLTWAGLKWAFVGWHASNWHPLTWLSHMLDCQLAGSNPGLQHFLNAVLHAGNAVLLLQLWVRLTGRLWPSALVAALFAWHPMHVESVAWISERKDVLCTFFSLLTLLAYVRAAGPPKAGDGIRDPRTQPSSFFHPRPSTGLRLWFPLFLFALALLSKPMAVTLPFVLLLLDYWPLGRWGRKEGGGRRPEGGDQRSRVGATGAARMPHPASLAANHPSPFAALPRLVAEKIPFFLLALASCVVTILAQGAEARATLHERPPGLRLENAVLACADYAGKTVWPARLAIIYPLPAQYDAAQVALAGVFLGVVSFLVWRWRRQSPWFLTGWLWFLGTLVPVIGLVQVGNQFMADRYSYFPSVGLFVAIVFGVADWVGRNQARLIPARAIAGVALCGCLAATERQLSFWQDTQTLFSHALEVAPNNPQAEMMLGVASERAGALEEAVRHYQRALQLDPSLVIRMLGGSQRRLAAQTALLQAQLAEQQNNAAQAVALYQAALREDSTLLEAHNNLGNLLDAAGAESEALAQYHAAEELAPADPLPRENLGTTLLKLGRFEDALRQYQEAARLQPRDPRAFYLIGKALLRHGQSTEAMLQFRHALELDADDFQSLAYLAKIQSTDNNPGNRDGRSAVNFAEKANALAGGTQPFVLDVLGMAYAEAGRFNDAQQAANQALELAEKAKLSSLTSLIRQHLQSYLAGQPCRENFTNSLSN
jgi:Flp pilus assembly protein TadD